MCLLFYYYNTKIDEIKVIQKHNKAFITTKTIN